MNKGVERASIIAQLLDRIKPIPENAPEEVKDAIDADRQFLAMRAGWTSMPIEELRTLLER
jgi:hypothetical protein